MSIGRSRALFFLWWLARLDSRVARRLVTLGSLLALVLLALALLALDALALLDGNTDRLIKLCCHILLSRELKCCKRDTITGMRMPCRCPRRFLMFAFFVMARLKDIEQRIV